MRIKELLKERGMTVTALAERVGVSQDRMSRIIRGNPTLETLQKVAKALEVTVSELLDEQDSNEHRCPNCGFRLDIRVGEKK